MATHATVDNDKHKISWTSGTTDAARRNTLVSDGPLKVGAGHFFAVVLQRSATAGVVTITYREVEFLLGEAFDPSTGLLVPRHAPGLGASGQHSLQPTLS